MPGHTKCCTCHTKSSQQPEDLRLQNATLLRKSAPGPPNSSDEDVSCTAPATENASLQMLFKCPTPAIFFGNATKPSRVAHFSLANVLHATTAYTFSTSQLPKVVRTWCVLYILTWKCASRHNGVQFFISHLARWLRTRRFSEPTFRPSGATNHWKNTAFRDFPTFSRTCIFFLLTLSLLWSSLFCSSSFLLLHLCFLSVHIVGSLTSKLPSVTSPLDPMKIPSNHHDSYWLAVWNRNLIFPIILGMSSSQLTNSIIFQKGRLNHQPVYMFGEIFGKTLE